MCGAIFESLYVIGPQLSPQLSLSISDCQPPGLGNKFLLFISTQRVQFCYSSLDRISRQVKTDSIFHLPAGKKNKCTPKTQ